MASRTGLEIEGLNQVTRALREFGDASEDMKKAFRKISDRGVRESKPQAPVVSGALRSSIRAANRKNAAVVMAGRKSVPYAGPIHWGWRKRNIPANPFIYDTAKRLENWSREQVLQDLRIIAHNAGLGFKTRF